MPEGLDQINALKEGGFSDEDIHAYMDKTRGELSGAGFSDREVNDYFGVPQFDPTKLQNHFDNAFQGFAQKRVGELLSTQEGSPPAAPPTPTSAEVDGEAQKPPDEAKTFFQAIEAGFQLSVPGLLKRGKAPDIDVSDSADWYMRVAKQAGLAVGDIPANILGGLIAAPEGLAAGPGAPIASVALAGAGATALPTALRETLMEHYQRGDVTDFKDFWSRASGIFLKTLKSAVVGGATMGVGGKVGQVVAPAMPLANTTAKIASEIGTMVTLGKALDGEVPKPQDFLDAGVVIAGLHGAGMIVPKLQDIYAKTGIKPSDVAEHATTDPLVRQELSDQGPGFPKTYEPFVDPASEKTTTSIEVPKKMGGGEIQVVREPLPPDIVQRVEEPGVGRADFSKPQGIYTSPGDVESPHSDLGGDTFYWRKNPEANVLRVDATEKVETQRGLVGQPAGIAALRQFVGDDEFTRLAQLKKPELIEELGRKYPDVDWGRMHDAHDALDAYGAMLAKAKGYDAIDAIDRQHKEFREYVGLTEKSMYPLDSPKDTFSRLLGGEGGAVKLPAKAEPLPERTPEVQKTLDRIGSRGDTKEPITWDKLYTMTLDKFHPIAQFRDAIMGDKELKAGQDPYTLARLTRGNAGRATQFLENAPFSFKTLQNVEGAKGLKDIVRPVADDLDGLQAFLLARRDTELLPRGIETGGDLETAKAVVKQGQGKFGQVAKDLTDYNNHLSQYLVDSGIVSPESAEQFRQVHQNYVPFYRVLEEEPSSAPGRGMRVRNPIKAMLGSDKKIVDPLESMIRNTYSYIELAERNRVLKSLVDMGQKYGAPPELLERVKTPMKPIDIQPEEMERFTSEFGIDADTAQQAMTIFRPLRAELAPDEIAMFRDGKREVYRVPEAVAESLKEMDAPSASLFMKIMSAPAKALRAGTIAMPEFTAKNFFRDQLFATMLSDNGYKPVLSFLSGAKEILSNGDAYQAWLKGGGAGANMVSIDRDYINDHILRLDPVQSATERIWNMVKSPVHIARLASELVENSTRVGEMKRALEGTAGKRSDIMQAAYDAREVTLDFARIGAKTSAFNQITAFFNPQLQGVDRLVRGAKADPMGVASKITAAVVLPSVLLWWANKDDDRMKEIPRWQKDLAWIIPTDKWQNATPEEAQAAGEAYRRNVNGQWQVNHGTVYRLPKPNEVGVVFGSLMERVLDAWYHHDPKAFKDLGDSIASIITPSYTPTALIPIIEQFANKSTFTGAPIVPDHLEKVLPEFQYTEYTSETAKLLSKLMAPVVPGGTNGLSIGSPMVLENYVRAWTGGMGTYALQIADQALYKSHIVAEPPKPTAALADEPIIKAFVVRYPAANAQSIVDFQQRYSEHSQFMATVQSLAGRGDYENSIKLRVAEENRGKMIDLDSAHETISKLKRMVELVSQNPQIKPDEKRQLVDSYYMGMIQVSRLGNKLIDDIDSQLKQK